MYPLLASLDDICWLKRRQIVQPKTGAFRFTMPELPRLDRLRRRLVVSYSLLGVPVHDRVFDAPHRDGRIPEIGEQGAALVKLVPKIALVKPPDAGIAKPRTGWMRDDQHVPTIPQDVPDIALDMTIAAVLCRQDIARPGVVVSVEERITDNAGKLTGDKDFHGVSHPRGSSQPRRCKLPPIPSRLAKSVWR